MNLRPLTLGPESEISRTYWEYRYAQINRILDNAANPDVKLKLLNALHRVVDVERKAFDERRIIKPVAPSIQTPELKSPTELRAHSLQLTHLYMTVERKLLESEPSPSPIKEAPKTAPEQTISKPSGIIQTLSAHLAKIPWKAIGQQGLDATIASARFTAATSKALYIKSAPLRRWADKHLVTVSKFAIDQAAKAAGEFDWIVQQEIVYPLLRKSFDNSARITDMSDRAKQRPKLAVATAFTAVAAPILLTAHLVSAPKPVSSELAESQPEAPSATLAYVAPNINPEPDDVPSVQAGKQKPAFDYNAWVAKQNRYLSQKYKLDPKKYNHPRPTYDYALASAPDLNVAPPARGKWNWDALLYNNKYEGLLLDAAEKMLGKRPSDVFRGIVMTESGGRQHGPDGQTIRSPKNAIGIAQVLPSTGKYIAPKCFGEDIDWDRFYNDKDYNYEAGRCYFKEQHDQFGNPILGALAYNGGPKGLEWRMQAYGKPVENTPEGMIDFVRSIKNPENRHYVPATMVKLGLISVEDLGPDVYTRTATKGRSPK